MATPIARTQDEMTTYLRRHNDPLGYAAEALLPFLDYVHAEPYLLDTNTRRGTVSFVDLCLNYSVPLNAVPIHISQGHQWTATSWTERYVDVERTEQTVLLLAKLTVKQVWRELELHRSIYAVRAIHRLAAFMFLTHREELVDFAYDPMHFPRMGAPVVARVAGVFGWPVPKKSQIHAMIDGRACQPDCILCCNDQAMRLDVIPL